MALTGSSELLVPLYQITLRHIPDNRKLTPVSVYDMNGSYS
jgi:hypothetical protein